MKIRMGFVTNSSGSSYTSIEIENKELAKILSKYTNQIKSSTRKKIELPEIRNNLIKDESYWGEDGSKSRFFSASIDGRNKIPTNFTNSLEPIVKKLNDETINEIFDEMKKELKEKEQIINNSYTKIIETNSGSADSISTENIREYDSNTICPICKSPLIYSMNYSNEYLYNKKIKKGISIKTTTEGIICSNVICKFEVSSEKNDNS